MKAYISVGLTLATVILSSACDETSPTTADAGLLPVAPTTVEVQIPFSSFGRDVQQTPGYGREGELNVGLVANEYGGAMTARALVKWATFPRVVSVANSAGIVVSDSTLSYIGGRIVARIDTTTAVYDGPVALVAERLEGGRWDPESASWDLAVDTVPDVRAWPEEGAGPVTIVDVKSWDPANGDSVVFDVDSATVNAWADTLDVGRGLRVSTVDVGSRVELASFLMQVDIVPSVRPDTVMERPVGIVKQGFVYAPPPPPPGTEFRIGGAPAWRTTFGVELADTLNGPPELCEAFGCPFLLTPESVNFAALTLHSATSPPGFQPDDTLSLDVRAVLSEADLPKSPLSASLGSPFGVSLPPEYFGDDPQGEVTIGVTSFVQDLLRGETLGGDPAPTALSLLTLFEPLTVELMTFEGGGGENEPFLRMILTTRVGVPLR